MNNGHESSDSYKKNDVKVGRNKRKIKSVTISQCCLYNKKIKDNILKKVLEEIKKVEEKNKIKNEGRENSF